MGKKGMALAGLLLGGFGALAFGAVHALLIVPIRGRL